MSLLSGHQLVTKFAAIADLLPTQVTLGMREVAYKRQRWRQKDRERAEHYLITHPIPVILGLESRHFILDRHHLTRALCDEGVVQVPISIVANESSLPHDEFWAVLERYYWVHPFDDKGERVSYRNIPKSISKLIDDPYRSLAGALKRAGGYTKDKSPFSEFRWADFLRSRIDSESIAGDFDGALHQAMHMAQSPEARELPGWLDKNESALPGCFVFTADLAEPRARTFGRIQAS